MRPILIMMILVLLAGGCSEAHLVESPRPVASNDFPSSAPTGEPQSSERDKAIEIVDEPAPVAGAFFACALDKSILDTVDVIGAGCRLERAGLKQVLTHRFTQNLAFFDSSNQEVNVFVAAEPTASQWNWTFHLPKDSAAGGSIRLLLSFVPTAEIQTKTAAIQDPYGLIDPNVKTSNDKTDNDKTNND